MDKMETRPDGQDLKSNPDGETGAAGRPENEARAYHRDRVNLNDLHRLRSTRAQNQTYKEPTAQINPTTTARFEQSNTDKSQGQSSIDFLRNKSAPSIGRVDATAASGLNERSSIPRATQMKENEDKSRKPTQSNEEKPGESEASKDVGSIFECNICLDTAKEPVVTQCGHLYCWKCIYKWIQQPRETLVCPVCKSGISQEKLTPIFTKDNTEDPRKKKSDDAAGSGGSSNIPNRPSGQRSAPEPNANFNNGGSFASSLFGGGGNQNGGISLGLGFFPFVTLNFSWDDINGLNVGNRNANGNAGPETTQQTMFRIAMIVIFCVVILMTLFGSNAFFIFQNLFLNLLPLLFFGLNFVNTPFWRGNRGANQNQNAQAAN